MMLFLLCVCVALLTVCAVAQALALWVLWRLYRQAPLVPDFLSAPWRTKKFYA